jgi:hypothetical protein
VKLLPRTERRDVIQAFESQETPILTVTDVQGGRVRATPLDGRPSVIAVLRDHLLPRLVDAGPEHLERV